MKVDKFIEQPRAWGLLVVIISVMKGTCRRVAKPVDRESHILIRRLTFLSKVRYFWCGKIEQRKSLP